MTPTGPTPTRARAGLRSPLFRRTFPAILILACLPLFATAVAALAMGRLSASEEAATRLRSDALLMREAARVPMRAKDRATCDALAKKLGKELETRFTLLESSGRVLGDSDHDPGTMENHAERDEIVAARVSGYGAASRTSATLGVETFYVAVRLDDADPAAGIIRAALPSRVLEARFRKSLALVAAVGAPLGTIAFVMLGLTLLAIVRDLGEVTNAAHAVARGGGSVPLDAAQRADELGDLARSVHAMAAELERRIVTIARERNELATIVAGMGEGLIAVDARGRLLLSNDAAKKLLALDATPAQGKDLVDVVPHGGIVAAVREALTKREPVARTVEIYLPTARGREIEARATPLPEGEGVVLLLRDVTEAARYERLRRDFVANVSHELRTPLTLVKGFLETLEDGALSDPEKGPRFLGIAGRHVAALEALVEDLLTLGRLDAGAETRPAGPVSVGEAIDNVVSGFEERVAKKGLSLEREMGKNLPAALGHADLIERAIRNLVDNAIKYTDQGKVTVRARVEDGEVVVEVSDTGPGITREDQERIFERFYRVEKSRSRDAGGTGLGLAIVKHVAQQEGGSVSVTSEPGKGSTFRLAFRAAPV